MDSASEEGEASSQGFSDQGTNTKSRTNSSDHERGEFHLSLLFLKHKEC